MAGAVLAAALLGAALLAPAQAETASVASTGNPFELTLGSTAAQQRSGVDSALNGRALSSMWQRQADHVRHFQLGQARFGLSVADVDLLHQRARLFGDYYLTGPGFADGHVDGGLRLTSGLAFGRAWAVPAPANGWEAPVLGRDNQNWAQPYLGLGYSRLSARAGWAFSADIGLGRWTAPEATRLGRGGPSDSQVERLLDDLRLSPVIQLGVRYAF